MGRTEENSNEMGTVWLSESAIKSTHVNYLAPQGCYNKVTS